MNWNEIFEYKDGVLYWKHNRRGGRGIKIGDSAGSRLQTGYTQIVFEGEHYLRHHIVWLMHGRCIPKGMEIDHIDHDRQNDRIENLRLVTASENSRNKSKPMTNKSGVVGITWHKRDLRWQAHIKIDGKKLYLGYFDNFNDAVKARKEAELLYNFHENHGK
ncbi:HNH endonuclease [Escherichia phage vB_EcoS_SA80RD]|nr:HNH endonuclease [Escherichia phage vB_EcoS_SA80RD]